MIQRYKHQQDAAQRGQNVIQVQNLQRHGLQGDAPHSWRAYRGARARGRLLSNTAGGYCFYRDARLRRLTRYRYNNCPLDQEGFHIYIKDADTVWNPGWQPAKTELDSYTCRHGLGYSVIAGQKNGVQATQTLFVPQGDACLLLRLTLKNDTDTEKVLDVFPYVEFCLWDAMDDGSNFQRNFSIGEALWRKRQPVLWAATVPGRLSWSGTQPV